MRYSKSIKWDAHACPSFSLNADLNFLKRYKRVGVNFVSLNVGFNLTSQVHTIALIKQFTKWLQEHNDDFALVKNIAEIFENIQKNKLSVAFDIEGSELLNGDLDMVDHLYDLGVRQLTFSYNKNNFTGGGCLDRFAKLTPFGEDLVQRCNKVGVVIDCSHVGYQTSLDIIDLSKHPVIFSHSNPAGLVSHFRNISNDQIISCANKGGVIGINGISAFLGDKSASSKTIIEHIDYLVKLVGPEHVGIGLDCVFALDEVSDYVINNPEVFPPDQKFNEMKVAEPEQFKEVGTLLKSSGYSIDDINNILGNNFFRIAEQVWKK